MSNSGIILRISLLYIAGDHHDKNKGLQAMFSFKPFNINSVYKYQF